METFAERLRYYREKAKYNQKELASIVGITFAAYNNYETKGAQPKIEILIKLAKALNIDVNTLVGFQRNEKDYSLQLLNKSGFEAEQNENGLYIIIFSDRIIATLTEATLISAAMTAKEKTDEILNPTQDNLFKEHFKFEFLSFLFEHHTKELIQRIKNRSDGTYTEKDVAVILHIRPDIARALISQWNEELKEKGIAVTENVIDARFFEKMVLKNTLNKYLEELNASPGTATPPDDVPK